MEKPTLGTTCTFALAVALVFGPLAMIPEARAGEAAAAGDDFPNERVRLIEPFGAGGGPDLLARALAERLSELWAQPVTVENVTGQGATAGPSLVARSRADGHTLLINSSAHAYSAALVNGLPYDPLRDFVPVAALTKQPYVFVAGKPARVKSLGELIAAAKAEPGRLTFTSTGVGTASHLGAEQFNQLAGLKAVHAAPGATASNADMIANVIAGRTTYCLAPISLAARPIAEGTLVALGVSTAQRSTLLPTVPTVAEAGLAGFDFPIWYGLWAPAGTPAKAVEKLELDVGRALAGAGMVDWLASHGAQALHMSQPEFARFVRGESETAAKIVKSAQSGAR